MSLNKIGGSRSVWLIVWNYPYISVSMQIYCSFLNDFCQETKKDLIKVLPYGLDEMLKIPFHPFLAQNHQIWHGKKIQKIQIFLKFTIFHKCFCMVGQAFSSKIIGGISFSTSHLNHISTSWSLSFLVRWQMSFKVKA